MGGFEVYFKDPALIWFIVGLGFLAAELVAPGLIVLFFGLGAWIVALICLFKPISLNAQLIIFILTSAVILVCLRNTFKTFFSGFTSKIQNPNIDLQDFIGQRVVVKESVIVGKGGRVELNGTLWNAEADEDIDVGENVVIVSKNNLTLKVKKG